jgi:acyl-coenzyme A synthetase/AMP-(fatty) acid ligase
MVKDFNGVLKLFVVCKKDVKPDAQLIELIKNSISIENASEQKIWGSIQFVANLPRGSNGKLQKYKLS